MLFNGYLICKRVNWQKKHNWQKIQDALTSIDMMLQVRFCIQLIKNLFKAMQLNKFDAFIIMEN